MGIMNNSPSHKQHKNIKHSVPAEGFQLHKILGSASVDNIFIQEQVQGLHLERDLIKKTMQAKILHSVFFCEMGT